MNQSKRLFRSAALFAATLFTTSLTALPGLAAGEVYPADVAKKYPKSFAAYQRIIPAAWRKSAWVYRLEGVAEPVRVIDYSGSKFVLGQVCKPHDCGANQLTFLVAVDGSAAYAQANSFDLTQAKDVVLGKPDAEAKKILAKGLD
jgi:hypothetical protein